MSFQNVWDKVKFSSYHHQQISDKANSASTYLTHWIWWNYGTTSVFFKIFISGNSGSGKLLWLLSPARLQTKTVLPVFNSRTAHFRQRQFCYYLTQTLHMTNYRTTSFLFKVFTAGNSESGKKFFSYHHQQDFRSKKNTVSFYSTLCIYWKQILTLR